MLRNLIQRIKLRKIAEQVSTALSALAVGATMFSMAAFAVTVPPTYAPRNFQTQQTGYLRIYVQATGTGIVANGVACAAAVTGGANCSVKVGALPPNAYLIRLSLEIYTNFNADTADTLSLGTNTTATNIVGGTSVHSGAGNISSPSFASGGSGTQLTAGVAQTGTDGGYDVYVNYAYTASTIATAGKAVWIIEYISPNDGTCVDTPMNTTPVAC